MTSTGRAAALLALFASLALATPAQAVSLETNPPVNNADYDLGFDAVKTQEWERAKFHLEIAARAEPANADVQNLLGYTYRNLRSYDLALTHYRQALKLDPKHRGAHEYIGETYLLLGDRAKAGEHLVALEGICGKTCEQYQDLARAMAKAR